MTNTYYNVHQSCVLLITPYEYAYARIMLDTNILMSRQGECHKGV